MAGAIPLEPDLLDRPERVNGLLEDLGPGDLILDGRDLDVHVGAALRSASMERTITGASSIVLVVRDRDGRLMRSGVLSRAVDLTLDELVFRLAGFEHSEEGDLTLTFEERAVALLRAKDDPKSADRDRVTRAEFIKSMVDEVKAHPIGFHTVGLHKNQPEARGDTRTNRTESSSSRKEFRQSKDRRRAKGLSDTARITVKGHPATALQRRVIEGCLEKADGLGASRRVMIAVVMCITQESEAGALAGITTGNDDVGIYQQGRNWISVAGSKQPGPSTEAFLISGPTSWKKRHGSVRNGAGSLTEMIHLVQGNARAEDYARHEAEATRTVDAFDGGGGHLSDSAAAGDDQEPEDYQFTRGQDGKREDSWTAMLRLAEEVQWRLFMVGNRVMFLRDEDLMRSRPRMTVRPDTEGLMTRPVFRMDTAAREQEGTIQCRAARWAAPPGSVVEVEDFGPADGRWLVSTIKRDNLFKAGTAITLVQPRRWKHEPAEVAGASGSGGASIRAGSLGGFGPQGDGAGAGNSSLRARIVAIAQTTLSSRTGHNYYIAGGVQTATQLANPLAKSPYRSDCSQWIHAVYLRAGAPSPGLTTDLMAGKARRTNAPKPGDLLLGPNHVELYIGGGRTIGHGTAPIDFSTVAYWRRQGFNFVTYDFLD